MKAKDIVIGEEYLATRSKDNRYESDRRRVRVLEAPVEGQAWNYRSSYGTGKKDSARVEHLNKETGEALENDRYTRHKVIRLAEIKMLWSEWVDEAQRREDQKNRLEQEYDKLLAERRRKLEELRNYFGDLTIQVSGGGWSSAKIPSTVFTEVVFKIDDLYDWMVADLSEGLKEIE